MSDRRPRILYDRRVRLGHGQTDQLRLYIEKASAPLGRISASSDVVSAILLALESSPAIRLAPLGRPEDEGRG